MVRKVPILLLILEAVEALKSTDGCNRPSQRSREGLSRMRFNCMNSSDGFHKKIDYRHLVKGLVQRSRIGVDTKIRTANMEQQQGQPR